MLPTASTLVRWQRQSDPSCPLCKSGIQTNKHVISNCPSSVALNRYTARHNNVLMLLINWLKTVISKNQQLWVDLPGIDLQSSGDLFINYRPDIAIVDNTSINTWELTICHETNLIASKRYKINKYSDLRNCCTTLSVGKSVSNFTVEVSTLGFISHISDFLNASKLPMLPIALKQDIIHSVLNSTFKLYCNRNSSVTYWHFDINYPSVALDY